MDSRRQRLLERIAKTPRQPGSRARRYSNELKRDIADYALERWAEGVSQREIAAEFDLAMSVLSKWMRHARRQRDAGQEPFASTKRKPVVWPRPGQTPAGSEPPSAAELEEFPLVLVLRLDQVTVDNDAQAQIRAWLDATQVEH